ncbi:DNA double-strand break repair nuclease NurA [Candidatus Dependentiae bacterium]|nr:DNA double-strand break repair nuclease NurA [Candidatus Dependentiae bacterium]
MLDHKKFLEKLDNCDERLFCNFAKDKDIAFALWNTIKNDNDLYLKIQNKKYSLLLPHWKGALGFCKKIAEPIEEYIILSVDGSQVYYDKHQGPECYLINIGAIFFNYKRIESSVFLSSQPQLFFLTDQNREHGSQDFINLHREELELKQALELTEQFVINHEQKNHLVLLDGSIIFFQIDQQWQENKESFLHKYLKILHKFYEKNILIAGYLSFPRNKELVNILKLISVQFDQSILSQALLFNQLTDMHITAFFLEKGYRSTIFKSTAPISYAYPSELKPYFCYLNIGVEIVRLEFPAWIAEQEVLVDKICKLAYDQAQKGLGYPVCLFEAHEQAVIKTIDKNFVYTMLQKRMKMQVAFQSMKSIKKQQVAV